jgi:ferrochelatase
MDSVTNDHKQPGPAGDEPSAETDLDRAIRELDRFRRPEAWTVPDAEASGGEVAAVHGEGHDDSPPAEAGDDGPADNRLPLHVDDAGQTNGDDDDDLFAPEPVAAEQPQRTGRSWYYDPVREPPPRSAEEPIAHAAVAEAAGARRGDEETDASADGDEGRFDAPADSTAAELSPRAVSDFDADEGPRIVHVDADFAARHSLSPIEDAVAEPDPAPAEEPAEPPYARTLSDFDSGEDTVSEPAQVAKASRLPPAGNVWPLAEAMKLPSDDDPPAESTRSEAPAAETESLSLSRRTFGLKRALDAHRLGISIDDLPGSRDLKPPMEQTAVPPRDTEVMDPAPAAAQTEAPRRGWIGGWDSAETSWKSVLGEATPAPDAAAGDPRPAAERHDWLGKRTAESPADAKRSGDGAAAALAVAAAGAAAAAPMAERKGWFGSRRKDEPEPVLPPEASPPQAERAGWFGRTKKPEASAVPAEPAPAAPASEPERRGWFSRKRAEPESKAVEQPPPAPNAERRGWFGSRKGVTPDPAPTAVAPPAASAKPDPFAEMAAAIGPKPVAVPEKARRGWFGARKSPAPEAGEAPAAARGQVDLTPVREALEAAALKRSETGEAAASAAVANLVGATLANLVEANRVGVLLVNLGTPDAPKARAVRRYLREFLSDRRVIEKDTFLWQLVLRCIILPFRPRSKARAYRSIWNQEKNESPLKTVTRSQAEKLGEVLAANGNISVDWAMRYGNPSMESRIKSLIGLGCGRILVVPLYPQYSSATTATVCDEAFRVLTRLRNQPSLRVAPPYYAETMYIEAIAASIEEELGKLPFEPEVILASYHGMPLEYVQKGDPYYRQCMRTTELLRERLTLSQSSLIATFQSRFGRAEWLKPYTDETLRKLAKDGVRRVAVVTPGFAADCLETLEEIAVENAHVFKKKGGKSFAYIPCLNDSQRGMLLIRELVERELRGWV